MLRKSIILDSYITIQMIYKRDVENTEWDIEDKLVLF